MASVPGADAAVALGELQAHDPELAELADDGARDRTGPVPLPRVGRDLGLGELAHGGPYRPLLVVELEVHGENCRR